jgi:predicted nucleotidyltransferase
MKLKSTVDEHDLRTALPRSRPEVQAALAAYVRRVAADYAGEVLSITLYGSQARGEADPESDIDLFVVVRRNTPDLRQVLADLAWQVQFEHDVVISDIIRSVDQLNQMQAGRFPYYQGLEREGILLWKSTSEPMPAYA